MRFSEVICEGEEEREQAATKENQRLLDDLKEMADEVINTYYDKDVLNVTFVDEFNPDEELASASRPAYINGMEYTVVIGVCRPYLKRYPLDLGEPVYRFDIWRGSNSWLSRKKTGQVSKCKAPTPRTLMDKLKKSLEKLAR